MQFVIDDTEVFGDLLPNGTWTGKLGNIQNGNNDMYLYPRAYLNRFNDFEFTTPVMYGEVYALMSRPMSLVNVIFSNNPFQPIIYLLIGITILILGTLGIVNEHRHFIQQDNNVNTFWSQLHSFVPFNATSWIHQSGLTRKVQIVTGSFALLLLLTYYQSNLIHQLLMPKWVPIISPRDIAYAIETFQSKVIICETDTETEIRNTHVGDVGLLSKAMVKNPPNYFMGDFESTMSQIISEKGILIDTMININSFLAKIPPHKCAEYSLVKLPLTSITYSLLVSKRRIDIMELLNSRIAEAFEYINLQLESAKPEELCLRHIFGENPPDPSFAALNLYALSASFAFILLFLFLSIFVFFLEVVIGKIWKQNVIEDVDDEEDNISMMINLKEFAKENRHLIIRKCATFLNHLEHLKIVHNDTQL